MTSTVIDVASQYSPTPIGRYVKHGRYSGERFREEFMIPALNQFDEVTVDLSGTSGLSTGFLDEAFAGLVRIQYMTKEEYFNRVIILNDDDPFVLDDIRKYVEDVEVGLEL